MRFSHDNIQWAKVWSYDFKFVLSGDLPTGRLPEIFILTIALRDSINGYIPVRHYIIVQVVVVHCRKLNIIIILLSS